MNKVHVPITPPTPLAPNWSPAVRRAALVTGGLMVAGSFRYRGIPQLALGALGVGLLTRGLSNASLTDLVGRVLAPIVRLERLIDIEASLEEVFNFWTSFDNFPRFMSYIRQVRVNDRGGLDWTASGPAGLPVHWEARVHRLIPNQLIAWKSVLGSMIGNEGRVSFRSLPSGKTRVRVELAYSPPVGALGYAVVRFLGFDPRERIDADLRHMKGLIEEESSDQSSLILRQSRVK